MDVVPEKEQGLRLGMPCGGTGTIPAWRGLFLPSSAEEHDRLFLISL